MPKKEAREQGIHLKIDATFDTVLSCPFCGSDEIELENTHTACYWVACADCGAQVTGQQYGMNKPSHKLTMKEHQAAKRSALAAWNTRYQRAGS